MLERPDVNLSWLKHTEHKFVAGLGNGTLPVSSFKYYLIQDYLFLVGYPSLNLRRRTDHTRYNLRKHMHSLHTKPKL